MSQHLLLIALFILIPGLAFVPIRWPYTVDKTFSQHVARRKSSINYYFGLFIVVLPILCVFFISYLIPKLELTIVTTLLILLASLTQIGCTVVPELEGRIKLHVSLAAISAVSLIAVLMTILFAKLSTIDFTAVFTSSIMMLGIVAIVGIFKDRLLPALILQSSYFAMFFVAILFVTY